MKPVLLNDSSQRRIDLEIRLYCAWYLYDFFELHAVFLRPLIALPHCFRHCTPLLHHTLTAHSVPWPLQPLVTQSCAQTLTSLICVPLTTIQLFPYLTSPCLAVTDFWDTTNPFLHVCFNITLLTNLPTSPPAFITFVQKYERPPPLFWVWYYLPPPLGNSFHRSHFARQSYS